MSSVVAHIFCALVIENILFCFDHFNMPHFVAPYRYLIFTQKIFPSAETIFAILPSHPKAFAFHSRRHRFIVMSVHINVIVYNLEMIAGTADTMPFGFKTYAVNVRWFIFFISCRLCCSFLWSQLYGDVHSKARRVSQWLPQDACAVSHKCIWLWQGIKVNQ